MFLFTCEDNPQAGDQPAQLAAKTKAKDLADLGIEVELFNMNKHNETFDIERFYAVRMTFWPQCPVGQCADPSLLFSCYFSSSMNAMQDIISLEDDETPDRYPDSSQRMAELLERVRRKEYKKRTLSRLPFHITENSSLSVRL